MLIQVRTSSDNYRIINVQLDKTESAKKAAFRYVWHRPEKDYQELTEYTDAVIYNELSAETATALNNMR